jgi:hypothetical protein
MVFEKISGIHLFGGIETGTFVVESGEQSGN